MLANWMFFWDWEGAPPQSASATAVEVLTGVSGGGAKKDNEYWPLPDDWWEARAGSIKEDIRNESAIHETGSRDEGPFVVNHAVVTELARLTSMRQSLTTQLTSLKSLDDLKQGAARIRELDAHIKSLRGQRYK